MPHRVPSQDEMASFVVLLRRWLTATQIARQEDAEPSWRFNPYIALSPLQAEVRRILRTSEYLVPYGWPPDLGARIADLRDERLFYHISRYVAHGTGERDLGRAGRDVAELGARIAAVAACVEQSLNDSPAPATDRPEADAAPALPDLVTLDEAAAAVHRKKRTLERQKTVGNLPPPSVEGGGGKPDLWEWAVIRPWLTEKYGVRLPARFPANRLTANH